MAKKYEGLTVTLGADTTALTQAMKDVNKQSKSIQSELREVNRALKFNPDDTILLSQKQKLLKEQVEGTSDKLSILKKALQDIPEEQKKLETKEFRDLQREIIVTESQLKKYNDQLNNSNATLEKLSIKADKFSKSTESLGKSFLPISAGIAAVAAVSVKSMDEVDEGIDNIAIATGATGDSLKEMQKIYEEVVTKLPVDFAVAGSALGELNTRFGYTGDALQLATEDFVKFAKVTKMDAADAVRLVSRAMGDAGIESNQYKNVLEMLTKASQASGIEISKLTENLTKYGAPMRALGFDTKESIAIFSQWELAGVNTETAFAGMKKAISTWSASGKDARVEFKRTLEEIEKAPDIAVATSMAIEAFGTKAGPDLADAIKGGKFAFEDFLKVLEESDGTIEATYGAIVDEVDDTQIAMQTFKVSLHDFGETISKTVGPILRDFSEKFKGLMNRFNELDDSSKKLIIVIGGIVFAIAPVLLIISKLSSMFSVLIAMITPLVNILFPSLATAVSIPLGPILAVIAAIGALVAAIVYLFTTNEEFRNNVMVVWDGIKQFIASTLQFIQDNFSFVFDAIGIVIDTALKVIQDIMAIFAALFSGDWEALGVAVSQLVSDIVSGIINYFQVMFNGIIEVFKTIVDWIVKQIQSLVDNIISFGSKFFDAGKAIVTSIWDGLKNMWTELTSWVSEKVSWLADQLFFWRKSKSEMEGSDDEGDEDGSHKLGIRRIPFDGYKAILHEGERVLTKSEVEKHNINPKNDINVTQNIYTKSVNPQAQQRQAAREFKKLALEV